MGRPTEHRNNSGEANGINLVVSESSQWRKKFRNDVETRKIGVFRCFSQWWWQCET